MRMVTEECDYLLGQELTFARAPGALGAELSLSAAPVRRADRRFYDTFDGRLRSAGLACVCENGRLALISGGGLGSEIASVAVPGGDERVLAVDLPPGPMRDALLPIVELRGLLSLVEIRSRVRMLAVLDEQDKTVLRLIVEQPAVVVPGRLPVSLPGRLRIAPVRGYDKWIPRVKRTLEERLRLNHAGRSLLDDAVHAAGGAVGGVSSKVEVMLAGEMRADLAAAVVLQRLLEVIKANLPGTLADVDAEFLHDLRVAIRRTRAVLRELRAVFPPQELAHFRAEFRWLQLATGRARDLDVHVLGFDEFRDELPEAVRSDLDPLLAVLRRRRASARGGMVRALGSSRAGKLVEDWRSFLDRLGASDSGGDSVAGAAGSPTSAVAGGLPISAVAGARIAHVYRVMVRMGRAIDGSSPPGAYHDLRKKGKELRYLLELFGAGVFPDDVVKPLVRTLKALQDTLGRHQDREVQVVALREIGEEVAEMPGGAAGLMAMGMLVERLEDQERAARAEFSSRFTAFASRSQRALVEDTFA